MRLAFSVSSPIHKSLVPHPIGVLLVAQKLSDAKMAKFAKLPEATILVIVVSIAPHPLRATLVMLVSTAQVGVQIKLCVLLAITASREAPRQLGVFWETSAKKVACPEKERVAALGTSVGCQPTKKCAGQDHIVLPEASRNQIVLLEAIVQPLPT